MTSPRMHMTETEKQARDRVESTPALKMYEHVILYADYMAQEDHIEYVATAPVERIVSWAKDIASEWDSEATELGYENYDG